MSLSALPKHHQRGRFGCRKPPAIIRFSSVLRRSSCPPTLHLSTMEPTRAVGPHYGAQNDEYRHITLERSRRRKATSRSGAGQQPGALRGMEATNQVSDPGGRRLNQRWLRKKRARATGRGGDAWTWVRTHSDTNSGDRVSGHACTSLRITCPFPGAFIAVRGHHTLRRVLHAPQYPCARIERFRAPSSRRSRRAVMGSRSLVRCFRCCRRWMCVLRRVYTPVEFPTRVRRADHHCIGSTGDAFVDTASGDDATSATRHRFRRPFPL